ncbi:P-loop containing nucleoside triphosphate hydrolase protein [Mariannaea sp. PMI_226]|nr:P-loop containing nucleoside triphosphate hydrolase protein [Mariannaea sp. PMI_226]
MNTSAFTSASAPPDCPPYADDAFGPVVAAACRKGFDFTITFEQSILVLLPASCLLVAAPFRLFRLRNAPVKVTGHGLRHLKLRLNDQTTLVILSLLQLVLAVLWSVHSLTAQFHRVSIAAACVSLVSSLMASALSYVEHVKSPRPSSLLNVFLFVSLLLDAALLRTLWLLPLAVVRESIPAVFTAAFCLKAMLIVLEAWDKSPYLVAGAGPYAPEVTAGLYARAVFAWVTPLLMTGFRRLLKPADLFTLDEDMCTAGLNKRFWRHWQKVPSKSSHRLIRCCVVTLRWSLVAVVLPRLALLAFTICQPLALNRFLTYIDDKSQPDSVGYGLVASYGLIYFGIATTQALYWHQNGRSVTMLRGVLVSAVFSKATETSITATDDSAAVTLMSSDVDVIVRAIREMHEFWANTIQIAIATWLLSAQIGYAASGPIIVSVVALLVTVGVAPLARKYRVSWLGNTQKRVGITSAMIGHIKSIKMSGLAKMLSETVAELRVDEVKSSQPFRIVSSITSSVAQVPLLLAPVVAFAMYHGVGGTKSGETLDATRLFSVLSLTILLAQPLFWMFELILDMSAAFGAFDRIEKFLVRETRREYRQIQNEAVPETPAMDNDGSIELQLLRNNDARMATGESIGNLAIDVRDATFAWSTEQSILKNVTFGVEHGQFVLLLGPVASGKSTLLKGLLGEVPNSTGTIRLGSKNLSWCDQEPWLLNKSIRDNIIGYSHFEPNFYDLVVQACDLERDFQQLPDRDMTIVGSKGLALSGGQKQRVSLARAVYSRPQVALFDDIFSGLDSNTARRIFKNVFHSDGLLRQWGTTIILATHSSFFLPSADRIICLGTDGTISEQESFHHLNKSGTYTQNLLADDSNHSSDSKQDPDQTDEQPDRTTNSKTQRTQNGDADKRRQLGDKTVYSFYFGSIGYAFLGILLTLEVAWAFLQSFPVVWLNFWAEANSSNEGSRNAYYLGVYAALQVAGVFWFALLIWFVIVRIAEKSGIYLHHTLLKTVIKAPLSIFTTTDHGSIITRFSQDIGMVDNSLPLALVVTLASFFGVIAKAGLLAISSYYVAIAFPFLFAFYYYLQRAYLRTSRQLRLLDLEEKAPVYTQFIETTDGLATLRAFGWAPAAIETNHALVDQSQRPFYLLLMVQRWLVLVLDMTTAALALMVVGFAFMLRGKVTVGLTGVSLVQLIGLSETLNLLIQFWTSIETSIGAVARIKQFSEDSGDENLPGETGEPPALWPDRGEIQIRHLTASYRAEETIKAFEDISLDIRPGEKIAICGRTGSGKSSLLLSLLRLLDPSSGTVTVDGIDLASLQREAIRTRFIVITQDQFVLPGTVRQNIDPFNVCPTESIIESLRLVGLWETLEARGGLDASFEEDSLSHGQRQLFCMARAVLRKSAGRILLLDEATSSVDTKTQEMVQKVIETQFKDHTVISVAHRLDTIVDFDRVVMLDNGRIVETGNPRELLASQSKFKQLWSVGMGAGK